MKSYAWFILVAITGTLACAASIGCLTSLNHYGIAGVLPALALVLLTFYTLYVRCRVDTVRSAALMSLGCAAIVKGLFATALLSQAAYLLTLLPIGLVVGWQGLRNIQRREWEAAVACTIILLLLCIPDFIWILTISH
jgi:hypothetical protein